MLKIPIQEMSQYLQLEQSLAEANLAQSSIYQAQFEVLQLLASGEIPLSGILTGAEKPIPVGKVKKLSFANKYIESNSRQKQAVEKACSTDNSILCIQGPPGTGKTSVILEIIQQELKRNKKLKILVVSQSNLAVDNVLERLIDLKEVEILRLGHEDKCTDKVNPYTYQKRIKSLERKAKVKLVFKNISKVFLAAPFMILNRKFRLKKGRLPGKYHLLEKSTKIIASTCIGSHNKFLSFLSDRSKSSFGLLIVDEAGRSTVMETLVPLQYVSKAILVGDHKQLPPIVTAEVRKSWSKKNGSCPGEVSLLEMLMSGLPKENIVTLNKQFRMHPEIGSFIGEVFYKEEVLENGVSEDERNFPIPDYPKAVSYHSTESYGEKSKERFDKKLKSYFNASEVHICMEQLKIIDKASLGAEPPSIGVISLYNGQVELLKRKISELEFKNINVSLDSVATLDSFQGREEDIILLSLVRRPENVSQFNAELYRFFLDIRRLNVALSRARKRLFIVGDLKRIAAVTKNQANVPGMEVAKALLSYIETNNLEVQLGN